MAESPVTGEGKYGEDTCIEGNMGGCVAIAFVPFHLLQATNLGLRPRHELQSKLLASTLVNPIEVPFFIPFIAPFAEFRLGLVCWLGFGLARRQASEAHHTHNPGVAQV